MAREHPTPRNTVIVAAVTVGLTAIVAMPALSQQQRIGAPPEAKNMQLVGFNDLQARSAYQPTIHKQGQRYIAYIGHHGGTNNAPKPVNPLTGQPEFNGTSILDVTDPKNPKYLAHIPGQEGQGESGGAQMAQVCDGRSLPKGDPNKVYMLRTFGNLGHEMWDVTKPEQPAFVTRVSWDLRDTHKNWWECDTGIAFLVSGVKSWRIRRMTEVFDLSDPAKPVKIREFGLDGQQPGATGAMPGDLHGAVSTGVQGNRLYFAYGINKGGVLQIIDREKLIKGPKEPTSENLLFPQVGRLDMNPMHGAHTTMPLGRITVQEFAKDQDKGQRDFVMIVGEVYANECGAPRQMVYFADTTIENKPMIVSNYTARELLGNFCERGGRFGAHASNESTAPVFYQKLTFISYFNGGVRMIDVRDPFNPREVGYFIPPITEATTRRCVKVEGGERCRTAIQTNNAETDDRGYVYTVDRANTGMHIVEVTGEARSIAGLP